MSKSSLVGETYHVNPESLAIAMRGLLWGIRVDGIEYDGEFTGRVDEDGKLLVKIKKKSDKQPKK